MHLQQWRSRRNLLILAPILLLLFAFYAYQENYTTIAGDNLSATPWQRWERWPALRRSILRVGAVLRCEAGRARACGCYDAVPIRAVRAPPDPTASPAPRCPPYFRWIDKDLAPWRATGIDRWRVDAGVREAAFRVTIVDGRVYARHYHSCHWDRAMFTVWGILRLVERFPGQVKDVDMLFNCADLPRVHAGDWLTTPVFGYSTKTDNSSLDITFPDWSFWGWPEMGIPDWEKQSQSIFEETRDLRWEDRDAAAYWKGDSYSSPARQSLLKCNASSNVDIRSQDWKEESQNGFQNSDLAKQCNHRYKIYAEGNAWSVSFKYIMACGSTVLNINQKFQDFFTRALVPWLHYVPVSSNSKEMCSSLEEAIGWGNRHPEQAVKIGKQGQQFIRQELSMDRIYDYMFHLINRYADLQRFKPRVPKGAVRECPPSVHCMAYRSQRLFLEAQRRPEPAIPCRME